MLLPNWIEKTGVKKVCELINVKESSVSDWKVRGTLPRAPLMVKIYQATKGKVTYREMVEWSAKNRR